MPLFDPDKNLTDLHKVFLFDKTLLELLDMSLDTPDTDKIKAIKKRSFNEGLIEGKTLNFYFRPSRRTANEIITNEILQLDAHVQATQDFTAYRIQKRIRELLHKKKIGDSIYHFDGQLGELPSAKDFICVGSRYSFYRVI